jgi:hypothetical protein
MNIIERLKFALLLPPISANDANFGGNTYVDTQGWSHVRFLFTTGALAAGVGSTAAGTAPLIEECDTTGGSYTAVSSAALADAISDSEDDSMFAIDVDLTKSRKRYMRVQAPDAGAGACLLCIHAILSKKDSGAFGGAAAESGLAEKISA